MAGTLSQLESVPRHAFMGHLYLIPLLIFKREKCEFSFLLALVETDPQKPEEYGLFYIQGPELQHGGNKGCPYLLRCHVSMERPYAGKGEWQ